jgi:uncharacterized protein with HEPN domain
MNDRPIRAWLIDAREYADQAHRIGRTLDGKLSDVRDYLAIRYCLLVVGEALNEVPESILAEITEIPWRQIIALRHRLVHGYWLIDMDIIMNIAHHEMEALITALDRLIGTFK